MSMLAEKKRKQKWSLNPRGKDWSEDSNKFGQKLLEKMGWSSGKGLGANENGITEHIKVSYKNDSKGMGYKETNDQWTEHETHFSALLESLSGETEKPEDIKPKSLEKKSKSSRARVHYKKFTRGKDLSRYSEKDLANIFGKKSLNSDTKQEKPEAEEKAEEVKEKNTYLINGGSMQDYFKKKLPNFGKINGYALGNNGVFKRDESESESEIKPSFGFGFKENSKNQENASKIEENGEKIGQEPLKRKKEKPTFISYVKSVENNEDSDMKQKKKRKFDNLEEAVETPKKKKKEKREDTPKKIKIKNDKNNDDLGLSNPGFDPLKTSLKIEKHVLKTIIESNSEESDAENSKINLKIHVTADVHRNNSLIINGVTEASNGEKYNKKENKKKRKSMENFKNIEDCSVMEIETSKEISSETIVKKKKKKDKYALENPNFNESCEESPKGYQLNEENPHQINFNDKKKKKKLKIKSSIEIDNPVFNDEDNSFQETDIKENPFEVKVKDKKKKKKLESENSMEIVNPVFNDEENSFQETDIKENPFEVKVKDKKKRKKLKSENSTEIVNPVFNDEENSFKETDIKENPYEVKVKDKKKKAKFENTTEIDNPVFIDEDKSFQELDVNENPYEVKVKEKKKKKKAKNVEKSEKNNQTVKENVENGIENSQFENVSDNLKEDLDLGENTYEVERKPKKSKKKSKENKEKGLDNPALNLNTTLDDIIIEDNLVLNVVTTPILKSKANESDPNLTGSISKVNNRQKPNLKRRKSVRFSDVTEERIIPSIEELRRLEDEENRNELFEINNQVINHNLLENSESFGQKMAKRRTLELGQDNVNFDRQKNDLEENLDEISKTFDRFQAEVENDINEKKLKSVTIEDIMVGEVGNPHGENEKLPEGTKLKFKYANFTEKSVAYWNNLTGAKKSYKNLIKGDILLTFKNTNLHEIEGYARKVKTEV